MRRSEDIKTETPLSKNWLWLLPITVISVFLMLLSKYPVLVGAKVFSPEAADKLGQFGDFIGGLLNPLISCFTLMVAIMVWRLQKSEMAETKKALEDQAKTSEQQRREARFFDLMKIYQNTVDAIFCKNGTVGKTALQLLSKDTYPFTSLMNQEFPTPRVIAELKQPIRDSWKQNQNKVTPYFRMTFQVLGQLEGLLKESHFEFSKLFRAQLSNEELALVAWCLLYSEKTDATELVAKYGLLKHLPEGALRSIVLEDSNISKHVFGRKFAEKQNAA
jgi:hypothetical protein